MFNPKPGQPVGARFGVHQPEGWARGRKELARVRLESDDAKGGCTTGKVDHRLMATMDAVEISHCHGRAPNFGVQALPVKVLLHPALGAGTQAR